MPKFSKTSRENLSECDIRLQHIFETIIDIYDIKILCGHRGELEQEELYAAGKTKVHYPNSKHNASPSSAVDVVPYPVNWSDRERFYFLAGLVKGVAQSQDVSIRWGGDWDSDNDFNDNSFDDLCHFEIDE